MHTKSKPFNCCPCLCCMLCCSQRLRPVAAACCGLRAETQHTCVGIDGKLGGSQQQQLTCMVAFSTVHMVVLGEWLWVWEGTRGRKTNAVLGDAFLGNVPTQKTENAEIRNPRKKNEKNGTEKKKNTENSERGPNPPNLLVFPVFGCWGGGNGGLGTDEQKSSETTQCFQDTLNFKASKTTLYLGRRQFSLCRPN